MSNEVGAGLRPRRRAGAAHRTTLVFVNTRRMAERVARHLGRAARRGGGRRAPRQPRRRRQRLDAEQRLKRGELKALVATASLELGIDIGDVDLVCQLGSPRSIATLPAARRPLRPRGRRRAEGAAVPAVARRAGRMRGAARRVRRGELDALRILPAPLDVLAQQIVAEAACREWRRGRALRAGAPRLAVRRLDARGLRRRRAHARRRLHDAPRPARRLRPSRRGQRQAARAARRAPGGADLRRRDPRQRRLRGGARAAGRHDRHASTRTSRSRASPATSSSSATRATASCEIEPGRVRVEDAQGAAPTIPFWLGEAPGRSDELSVAVSRLRDGGRRRARRDGGVTRPLRALAGSEIGLDDAAARSSSTTSRRAVAALGALPTQQRIVLERFFDESGGMQLVDPRAVRQPHQPRLGPGAAQALLPHASISSCRRRRPRTRSCCRCRPATASRSTRSPATCIRRPRCDVLMQALLDAPMFGMRWRWNATTALALPRFRGGRKVPPQLQRMGRRTCSRRCSPTRSPAPRTSPASARFPTIRWSRRRCTTACTRRWTSTGWLAVLRRIEAGEVEVVARDLPEPSPLAAEALSARPYAFLDDAPLEERRTQAVQSRRWPTPTAPTSSAGSTPRRSRACARRRGPSRATPTRCTMR